MARLLNSAGIWLLSLLIAIAPSLLKAIGAIQD